MTREIKKKKYVMKNDQENKNEKTRLLSDHRNLGKVVEIQLCIFFQFEH